MRSETTSIMPSIDSHPMTARSARRHQAGWLRLTILLLTLVLLAWAWLLLPDGLVSIELNGRPLNGVESFAIGVSGLAIGLLALACVGVLLMLLAAGLSLLLVFILACVAGAVLLAILPISLPVLVLAGLIYWLVRRS